MLLIAADVLQIRCTAAGIERADFRLPECTRMYRFQLYIS